jgi:hypothetical protein
MLPLVGQMESLNHLIHLWIPILVRAQPKEHLAMLLPAAYVAAPTNTLNEHQYILYNQVFENYIKWTFKFLNIEPQMAFKSTRFHRIVSHLGEKARMFVFIETLCFFLFP